MTIDGLSLVAGIVFINLIGLSIYWFLTGADRRRRDIEDAARLRHPSGPPMYNPDNPQRMRVIGLPVCTRCDQTVDPVDEGTVADHMCAEERA